MTYRIKKTSYKLGDPTFRVQRRFLWIFWFNTRKGDHSFGGKQFIGTELGKLSLAEREIVVRTEAKLLGKVDKVEFIK